MGLAAAQCVLLPNLPRPFDGAGVGDSGAPPLLIGQEFNRALQLRGLDLETRVHLGVDGAESHLGNGGTARAAVNEALARAREAL